MKKILIKLIDKFTSFYFLQKITQIKLKDKSFIYNDVQLPYFFHSYNNFGLTERSIEIPIVKYLLDFYKPDKVLEIGNVTKHYYDLFKLFFEKDTIDKYEVAYDVINEDIANYLHSPKYDLIYSISTFEHMDSDGGRNKEYKKNNDSKFSSIAFKNMDYVINNLLENGGHFIVSFPLGYCRGEIDYSFLKEEYNKFNIDKINICVYKKYDELNWSKITNIGNITINTYGDKPTVPQYLCILDIRKG